MKKIILLIHITYLTAVGLGGASLQVDAVSLAHNGTGIAGDVNISINPVSILNVSNNKLSFSYNNWFNEVKGNMIKHEFNNQYIENGAIYITKFSSFRKSQSRISGKIGLYEMPEEISIDIDTREDFELVGKMLKK